MIHDFCMCALQAVTTHWLGHTRALHTAYTEIHTSMCRTLFLTPLGLGVHVLTGATHVQVYKLLVVPGPSRSIKDRCERKKGR